MLQCQWPQCLAEIYFMVTISEVRRNRPFTPSVEPKNSDTKTLTLMDRGFNSLESLNGRSLNFEIGAGVTTAEIKIL